MMTAVGGDPDRPVAAQHHHDAAAVHIVIPHNFRDPAKLPAGERVPADYDAVYARSPAVAGVSRHVPTAKGAFH
jgi:hypothetical protein